MGGIIYYIIELFTFLDRRDTALLSRSSSIRNTCSHLGAAMALASFLDELEYGLEPQLIPVNPEADRLLVVRTEDKNAIRVDSLVACTNFNPEDILVSAIKHMIDCDLRVLKNETEIEVAKIHEIKSQD